MPATPRTLVRLRQGFALLLALTLGTVTTLADSVAGKWEINAEGHQGVLLLRQDGTRITGTYRNTRSTAGSEGSVQGTLQNGEIRLTCVDTRNGMKQEYRGFLFAQDNATMAGTFTQAGNREGGWVARLLEAHPAAHRPPHQKPPSIVGSWEWAAGQTLRVREDGAVIVYKGDRQINSGKWEKQPDGSFRFTYQQGGFVDTLHLSDDGESVFGKNNQGRDLRATRSLLYAASIVGTWSWSAGQTIKVYPDGKLSVYKGDRQTNSGHWELQPDDSIRFIHALGGYVDTVRLSADGQVIEGKNKQGDRVRGTRIE